MVGVRFNAVWTELEAQAEPAFLADNNNPPVVCCHGISTKMLFLIWSSQQNRVANETVDLTRFFGYCSSVCFVLFCFFQGTIGFVKKYTWSLALVGEFAVADNGT